MVEDIQDIINRHPLIQESLIPVLQEVQDKFGYVPVEVVPRLAESLNVSPSQIQGVITFYSQFHTSPRGRNLVKVCRGTACHVRGARGVLRVIQKRLDLEDGQTSDDYSFSLETVA
jgi:NADH-quinone oxidoreductase subunit E/NADP-reducing hydrogenase subunit HndA